MYQGAFCDGFVIGCNGKKSTSYGRVTIRALQGCDKRSEKENNDKKNETIKKESPKRLGYVMELEDLVRGVRNGIPTRYGVKSAYGPHAVYNCYVDRVHSTKAKERCSLKETSKNITVLNDSARRQSRLCLSQVRKEHIGSENEPEVIGQSN